jgi:SOS response regulatory protein OraA/RecX
MKFELDKNENINIDYKISKIKESNNYIVLYLDNNEKLYVSIEAYFKHNLANLKGFDNKTYELLKKEENLILGYNAVLKKLSIKDHSIKQIKDFLYLKRKLDNDEVNKIIDKLIQYNLLDDEKYCIERINYLNEQLFSIKQIKNKLKNEGISNELIEKYIVSDSNKEYEKVYKLVNKYLNSVKNKSLNAKKQLILNKVVNLGFNYDDVKMAIDSLDIKVDNEYELLKKEYLKIKNKYQRKYESYDLKYRISGYLMNKGFKLEDINKVMEEENEEICKGS